MATGVHTIPKIFVTRMRFDDIPDALPHFENNRITPDAFATRIAQRQAAVADRMLG